MIDFPDIRMVPQHLNKLISITYTYTWTNLTSERKGIPKACIRQETLVWSNSFSLSLRVPKYRKSILSKCLNLFFNFSSSHQHTKPKWLFKETHLSSTVGNTVYSDLWRHSFMRLISSVLSNPDFSPSAHFRKIWKT